MVEPASPHLNDWLRDPLLRSAYQQSIQTVLDISHSQPRPVARSLTQHASALIAPHVPCTTCNGSGHVLDIVAILSGLPKPVHRIPAAPGPVPYPDCRWICPICRPIKSVFSKTGDLRRHLKDHHGFSAKGTKYVFDPKRENNERLWEHCGPCTISQAEANGWDFHTWEVDKRNSRASQIFFRALGSKNNIQEWGAAFAKSFILSSTLTSTSGLFRYGTVNSPTASMSSMSLLDPLRHNLTSSSQPIDDQSPQDDIVMQTGAYFDQSANNVNAMSQSTILPGHLDDNQFADFERMLHSEDEHVPTGNPGLNEDDPFLDASMSWHGDRTITFNYQTGYTPPQPWSPLSGSTELSDQNM